jgi:hypothetical protein
MRRVAAALVALVIAAGCGSSGTTQAERGAQIMTTACLQFAQTFLTTDPNSGLQQINVQQASSAIQQATATARNAAAYDKKWKPAAESLNKVYVALRDQDDKKMRVAMPEVQHVCTPLISKFSQGTTVP